ncbi:hypothetical protein ACLB2K_013838 [Fragaria x ananassa]
MRGRITHPDQIRFGYAIATKVTFLHRTAATSLTVTELARIVALDRQQTTFSPEYDHTASQVPINPSTRIHERLPLTFHHHHHCLIVMSGHINQMPTVQPDERENFFLKP